MCYLTYLVCPLHDPLLYTRMHTCKQSHITHKDKESTIGTGVSYLASICDYTIGIMQFKHAH